MANTKNDFKNESRSINTIDHPEPGKRWTLMFIGNHGRTVTLKRFKGMVILVCLVLCVSLSINGGLLYLGLSVHAEKNRLESDLKGFKEQIAALRYEKDVLLTKLVLAESRSNQNPPKKISPPREPDIPPIKSAVDENRVPKVALAGIQEEPPIKKGPAPPPPDSRADSTLSVSVENFKVFPKPEENLLRVQFKIKNTSPNGQRVAGRAIVVLKGEQLRQNQWLTIPRISLSNGKPAGPRRGQRFGIKHFKEMRFKTSFPKSPDLYRDATVFVFAKTGDLLLEKNFPVKLPALQPAVAMKQTSNKPSAPFTASSSRSYTGASSLSSAGPQSSTTTEKSLPSSAVTPPTPDDLMNVLKNTTTD